MGIRTSVNEDLAPLGDAAPHIERAAQEFHRRLEQEHGPLDVTVPDEDLSALDGAWGGTPNTRPMGGIDLPHPEWVGHLGRAVPDVKAVVPIEVLPGLWPNPDEGVWWWAQSRAWWPGSPIGMTGLTQPDGIHFRGQIDRDNGNLWKSSFGVWSAFAIDSRRLPSPGWARSRPPANLRGSVAGLTGVSAPLTFGDQWAKCWLHLDHRVRDEDGAVIAEEHSVENLIFREHGGQHISRPLPGSVQYPELSFEIERHRPLITELEMKVDIQIEGGSSLRLGTWDQMIDTIYRGDQWKLET